MNSEQLVAPLESLKSLLGAYGQVIVASGFELPKDVKNELCFFQNDQKGKLSIAFLGGYSAGKTTFISRILGKLSASTSPVPETATIVKHSASSKNFVRINFKDNYSDEIGSFAKILKSFSLLDGFSEVSANNFEVVDESRFLFENQKPEILLNFLAQIKPHVASIKDIELQHYVGSGYSVLKYADLYDLPGIGGTDDHDTVLANFLTSLKSYDIIVYLLDTSRGIIDENEISFVKNAMSIIAEDIPTRKQWYWLFQKPTEEDCDVYLRQAKDSMRNVMSESFNNFSQDVLEKTLFMTAFGDKAEHAIAESCITYVIMNNYNTRIQRLYSNLNFENKKNVLCRFMVNNAGDTTYIEKYFYDQLVSFCESNSESGVTRDQLIAFMHEIVCSSTIHSLHSHDVLFANRVADSLERFFADISSKILPDSKNLKKNGPASGKSALSLSFLASKLFSPASENEDQTVLMIDFNYVKYNFKNDLESDNARLLWSSLYATFFMSLFTKKELPSIFTNGIISCIYSSLRDSLNAFTSDLGTYKNSVNML